MRQRRSPGLHTDALGKRSGIECKRHPTSEGSITRNADVCESPPHQSPRRVVGDAVDSNRTKGKILEAQLSPPSVLPCLPTHRPLSNLTGPFPLPSSA